MKIKLQNTLTGNFYANGAWSANASGAEIIEKDSADYAAIRYTWAMTHVVEIAAERERRQFRVTLGSNWDLLTEAKPGDLVGFGRSAVIQGMVDPILATYNLAVESESYRGGNGWNGKTRPYLVAKVKARTA